MWTIWGGRDTTTIWMDLRDAPSRKFKAFVTYSNGPAGAYVLNVFFSPDGIHWTGPQAVPDRVVDRSPEVGRGNEHRLVAAEMGEGVSRLAARPAGSAGPPCPSEP